MPHLGSRRIEVTIGSLTYTGTDQTSGSGLASADESLPAAKTGALTTRSDANTGTLTMTAGHGITTGQIVDIYWDGGRQYNVTVGTVSVNSVPIDGGAGDDLPAQDTAVTVQVQAEFAVTILGDDLRQLAAQIPAAASGDAARVGYYDGASEILSLDLGALAPYQWSINDGIASPLAGGTIDKIVVTHKSSAGAQTFRTSAVYEAD